VNLVEVGLVLCVSFSMVSNNIIVVCFRHMGIYSFRFNTFSVELDKLVL